MTLHYSTPPKAKSCQVVQNRRSSNLAKVGTAPGKYRTAGQLGWINVDAGRLKTFLCWEGCIIRRPIGKIPFPEGHERPSFCSGTWKTRKEGGLCCRFAGTTRAVRGFGSRWKQREICLDVTGARASPAAACRSSRLLWCNLL
jgi:hypothetical protein